MPARFRNRPQDVQAIQWVGEANCAEVFRFVGLDHEDWAEETDHTVLYLPTLDNPPARHGDWLVKNQYGQVQVMRPSEFEARFEAMPTPEPRDGGLLYHGSVDDFRRSLMKAHASWERESKTYQCEPGGEPERIRAVAHSAALMAGSYAYTIAALVKYAQRFGSHVAHDLAFVADDILMNGDDDNLNADVIDPQVGGESR